MANTNKILDNALKILECLVSEGATAGADIRLQDIFNSVGLQEKEFDSADTFLLQQKYVEGTMGGMSGTRWLTGSGIEFYDQNKTVSVDNTKYEEVDHMPDPKKVFVVHGRDIALRDDFFSFIRALSLTPIEWSEALKLTGKATPYTGEAIESAFRTAQAVIVLLSPDDEVRLTPQLWQNHEDEWEKEVRLQARPNVLFEAGMAFGTNPDRTLLIQVGEVKTFSDVAGRHVVRLSNSPEKRNDIAQRLITSGCDAIITGSDWLNIGNFDVTRKIQYDSISTVQEDWSEDDILSELYDWWPESEGSFPRDVKVHFGQLDKQLSLPSGSTKKYINQVASRKGFKSVSFGNIVAIFEYDVTSDDFSTYFRPA